MPVPTRSDVERSELARRMEFATTLTAILNENGITHRQLADGCGWNAHTRIYPWLDGKSEPTPHQVFAMEDWLELDPGTLSRPLGYRRACEDNGLPEGAAAVVAAWPKLDERARQVIRSVVEQFTPSEPTRPRRRS